MTQLAPKEGENVAVSNAQIFMLHVLDQELESWVKENPNIESTQFLTEESVLPVLDWLTESVLRAEEILIRIARNGPLTPTEPPSLEESPLVDFAWVSLQIISSLTVALGSIYKSSPQCLRQIQTLIRTFFYPNFPDYIIIF